MSTRTKVARRLHWGQPRCTCGDRECQQLDFEVLGIPAWLLSLGLIVAAVVAMLAYTAAQRI